MDLSSYMALPEAILIFHRNALFHSWQALEQQQSQVTDPEVYRKLDQVNQTLFSAWMIFRDISVNMTVSTTPEQAVMEGENDLCIE